MGNGITNSILLMLVVMLAINVGLTFTQTAVSELRTNTTDLSILNESNSPLSNYYSGTSLESGVSLINSSYIPSDDTSADSGDSSTFTDIYVALRSWVSSGLNSLGFLGNMLLQPAGFLRDIGVNTAIVLSIQIIWGMMFILLLTAWIMGRT